MSQNKYICPWCKFKSKYSYLDIRENDLFYCPDCKNKIEVVKDNLKLKFVKSFDTYGD